jgi:hypothetical protein
MGLPIFRNMVEALPGIRLLPPLRLLLLVSAAGVPLATFGLERFLGGQRPPASGPAALAFICAVLAAFAIAIFDILRERHAAAGGLPSQTSALEWTLAVLILSAVSAVLLAAKALSPFVFAGLITGLATLELLHQGMRLYGYSSPSDLYPETPLLRFLHSQPPPYRIAGDDNVLFPNTNVFALLENVATHDPAERRDYMQLLNRAAGYSLFEYFKTIHDLNSSVLDFLNAKYLVAPAGRPTPGSKWTLRYDGPDGRVFENRNVQPRVFTPPGIRWISPDASAHPANDAVLAFGKPLDELLASGAFSEQAVVLSRPDFMQGLTSENRNGSARIENLTETTNRVRFEASVSGGPAIAVSSFTTDGGWSAHDDSGSELPTSYANGPFLAIRLPPGRHVVTLTYVPPGFRTGAAIFVATALGLIALLGLTKPQRRAARI